MAQRSSQVPSDRVESGDVGSSEKGNQQCEECGGSVVMADDETEYICQECGLVIEESNVDRGPEWRSLDNASKSKSRVGPPIDLNRRNMGLCTEIGYGSDGNSNSLSAKKKAKMGRLRREHKRSQMKDGRDRYLGFTLGEITRMGSALGIPDDVREMASVICRQYYDQTNVSRAGEIVAAASLYAATKQSGMPRSLRDIYPVCRVVNDYGDPGGNNSRVGTTYHKICNQLGLEIAPVKPESFFDRILSGLSIESPQEVRSLSKKLIDDARLENRHSGHPPSVLAASVIYSACKILDEEVTQDDVSAASGVSDVSIRNRYQDIIKASDVERCDVVASGYCD